MRWLDDMENKFRYTQVGRWRLQASVGLRTLQSKATWRSLFILVAKSVAVNSKKCSVLPWKCKNVLPLHCCRATKYFVLPLTIISIDTKSVCVYSCLSYTACKPHIICAIIFRQPRPVWRFHIFPHYLIKGKISGKKLLNMNYMLWFYLQRVPNSFIFIFFRFYFFLSMYIWFYSCLTF